MKPRLEFTGGTVATMAALIAFQAGTFAPLRAQAVGSCEMDMSDRGLAEQFAPQLWFGPGERDFPVIPFYTAFDGVNNNGSNEIDFADLSEIAAMDLNQPASVPSTRLDSLASWDSLYVKRSRPESTGGVGTAEAAVFYRVRTLTSLDRNEMWRFLLKDPQAWHRNEMSSRWPRQLRERTHFKVIEYYFYYLNDAGLEGHREDIEFVFVFVPAVQELACRFRMVVGAGHVPRTPNNVLVSFDEDAGVRPSIFVELGGHASAPDMNENGGSGDRRFEVGKDVNWHASDVWGTRDLLAVTGTGFSGPYRTEYTLSRRDDAVRFFPVNSGPRGGYRLLPVEPFARLSALLDESVPVEDSLIATLKVIRGELNRFQSNQSEWRPFSAPDTLSDAQIRRMQTWNRDLWTSTGERLTATKHQIWQHRHYRLSPVLILKEHLYQPSFSAILNAGDVASLLTYGFSVYPGEGWGGHVGFVIPTIRFAARLPGLVQFQFGFVQNDWKRDWSGIWPGRLALSGLYDSQYGGLFGWYTKVGYVRNREDLFDDEVGGPGDFTISAGLSALLWSWDRRRLDGIPGGPHSFRLRVGPRVGLKGWTNMLDGMGLEVLVSLRH